MKTGFVFKHQYLWHDTGTGAQMLPPGPFCEPGLHIESPASKRRFEALLQVSGLAKHLVMLDPVPATDHQLLRVHTREYLDSLAERSRLGTGFAQGEEAPMGLHSYEIARLSAGGTIRAVEAVIKGEVQSAYALVRPPGHHAEPTRAMGYCLLGNIPIAVRHAQSEFKLGRVAVLDWDVHHGNGTETVFYEDPSVLTVSIHQDNCYPIGRGAVDDRGQGPGFGFNLNIPLPPGSGWGAYEAAMKRVVLPALDAFRPELIVVASGFDANAFDPLGRMLLSSEAYARMTAMMQDAAERLCGGRLVLSHEGGYSESYVPFCGQAVLEQLTGVRTAVRDPVVDEIREWGGERLLPHQDAAVKLAESGVAMLKASLK